MSLSSPRPKPRRASVATEEERAWISFYQRVGSDAALAVEVLAQLDADVEMKRQHLALWATRREMGAAPVELPVLHALKRF